MRAHIQVKDNFNQSKVGIACDLSSIGRKPVGAPCAPATMNKGVLPLASIVSVPSMTHRPSMGTMLPPGVLEHIGFFAPPRLAACLLLFCDIWLLLHRVSVYPFVWLFMV
jgi:hypothetical protein